MLDSGHGLDHASLPPQFTVKLVKLSEESCVWPNISVLPDLKINVHKFNVQVIKGTKAKVSFEISFFTKVIICIL